MRSLLTAAALLSGLLACRATGAGPEAATPSTDAPKSGSACDAARLGPLADEVLAQLGHPGAMIVLDPHTKEQIAAAYAGIEATSAMPPASTLKPFLAAAALEQELIDPNESFDCDGLWQRDELELSCFAEHGPLDLRAALATSCNTYFYEVAARLGPERMAAALRQAGLANVGDAVALSPDLETAIATAIGHGDAAVTPLALAVAYAQLATDPRPELEPVRAGMRDVVDAPHGSGRAVAISGIAIAGKTGTAESTERNVEHIHRWFVGYAPAESPRVLVLAYVDGDRLGADVAARAAARMFEAWGEHCLVE